MARPLPGRAFQGRPLRRAAPKQENEYNREGSSEVDEIAEVEAAKAGDRAAEDYHESKRQELREAVRRARRAGVTYQAICDAAQVSMMTARKWVDEGDNDETGK